MKIVARYHTPRMKPLSEAPARDGWTPPQDFDEFMTRYPNMLSTMAKNALLKLQQGRLHVTDQAEDLASYLAIVIMDTQKIRKFDVTRHPKTPENGFKAYMWLVITSLAKNWVKEQDYFNVPIDNPEANPGCSCVPEHNLPASSLDNPYDAFVKSQVAESANKRIRKFIGFLQSQECPCEVSIEAITRLCFGGASSLHDIQEQLELTDKDRHTLKIKLQELWQVFTLEEHKNRSLV